MRHNHPNGATCPPVDILAEDPMSMDHGVLASAKVRTYEYDPTWRKPWILFALGREGLHVEVEPVAAFLEEQ